MQKNLTQCKKTEMVISKSIYTKEIWRCFKNQIMWVKDHNPTESAKYLGKKIDTNLSWQDH